MKKSEKIEIRISPEDKEALARRAEAEGRPASEVVRDLLQSGGVTAQAQTVPEGPSRPVLYGLGAGLFAGGSFLGFLLGLLPDEPARPAAMMAVRFSTSGDGPGEAMPYREARAIVPAGQLDGAEVFIATGQGRGYRLFVTSEDAGPVSTTRFDVCRQTVSDCEPLASPTVTRAAGTAARIGTDVPDGPSFVIRLEPVEPEPTRPSEDA